MRFRTMPVASKCVSNHTNEGQMRTASSFNCIKRIDAALHGLSETRHTRLLNNRHHPSGCGLDPDRFIGL